MARPSQSQDEALLQAAAALYPSVGVQGLSVRRVAQAAGVRPAMLHYHFGDKAAFVRAVLQRGYETMFEPLSRSEQADAPAIERLRRVLIDLARFVRDERPLVVRLVADAMAGDPVVREFLQTNVPRHVRLLMRLMAQAQLDGALAPHAPLKRLVFTMGSVVLPLLVLPGVADAAVAPAEVVAGLDAQVLSDDAISERVDWALAALGAPDRLKGSP